MAMNPMPSMPGTQSESGLPPPKPANNDRWGKFGVKNPSAPKARDDSADASPSYAKGGSVKSCSYAEGGAVLGRSRSFMKEPSPFRSSTDGIAPANQRPVAAGGAPGEPTSSYPKSGKGEQGKDKSMKTVMPRK